MTKAERDLLLRIAEVVLSLDSDVDCIGSTGQGSRYGMGYEERKELRDMLDKVRYNK